ncbi:MAG TPA: proline--tRNA ligase [Anaerolineales bacterium]|nr:proline--tRNA ligase [Anaerolineales bacterium]
MSNLFGQTLREAPSEAEITSHQLLLRAGYIRQIGAGIFSTLHLAKRSITKIENIMRQEIDAIGGQEISMPVVNPADLWKESDRWYKIGSELSRFEDKNDRPMVLALSHEEVVSDLVRREIQSYRQLPRLIYHIQTKWRDDPRPRAGLIRVREFTMKDSYSLDADVEGLDRQYKRHYQAYFNIFHQCGLPVVAVEADVGMMGGYLAHEFMYLNPIGEDTIFICRNCGYKANRQIAEFRKEQLREETPLPLSEVETPDAKTIESLAQYLGVPDSKTAKAIFLIATLPNAEGEKEEFVFVIIRGDTELNETKLAHVVNAQTLRPAREDEIRAVGAVPGYASPVGLEGVLVVVDDLIPTSPNLVAGANREGFHLRNVNYGRDYKASYVADITAAEEGDPCPVCGTPLGMSRGVEVGNIFKLGTRFSEAFGCTYVDPDGKIRPVIMGSYGIGSGRLLASIVEEHHDDRGLALPISVAPFQVHLVQLKGGENTSEDLYRAFKDEGVEVLYDDRDETAGVKFADADLIGNPIRVTVSQRTLSEKGVEVKLRKETKAVVVPLDSLYREITARIDGLRRELLDRVVEIPYDDQEDSIPPQKTN